MNQALRQSLAEKVKLAREAAGIQQQELANVVGLTRTSISNIERGKQGLSVDLLYSIADALNENPASLLSSAVDDIRRPVKSHDVHKEVGDPMTADAIFKLLYKELG